MDTIETYTFHLEGISGLIMHSGRTANPLNHFTKAMKVISGKRKKVDEDLEALATLEWWAGLYTSEEPEIVSAEEGRVLIDKSASVTLPAHVLDSVIREGARKSKMGKQASAGVIVCGDAKLIHDGPADINTLAADIKYRRTDAVKVTTSKVMRTRPFFQTWAVDVECQIDESVLEVSDVKRALEMAGKLVGIGDWRPGAPRGGSFGRFVVE